jgi:hypothetical protein
MIPMFDDLTEQERKIVDVLHSIHGWPIDFGKDAELVRRLSQAYPGLDLYAEAIGFAAWLSEHQQKKAIKYRARLVNWIKKAHEWKEQNRRPRAAHRAPEQDTHGTTVSVSEGF